MVLCLEISLTLLVRELIPEESLHCGLKNAFWEFLNHHGGQIQNSPAGVWVNSEGIPQWINSQLASQAVHYCYSHIPIVILAPGAVFTFLSRFVCSKLRRNSFLFPISCILLVQLNFSKRGHFASSAFFTTSLKFSVSFCKDCESAKHLRFSDYKFYSLPAWRALDHSFILCFPQDPLIKSEGIVRKSAISK